MYKSKKYNFRRVYFVYILGSKTEIVAVSRGKYAAWAKGRLLNAPSLFLVNRLGPRSFEDWVKISYRISKRDWRNMVILILNLWISTATIAQRSM